MKRIEEQAARVETDLIMSGAVPNRDTYIWKPVQSLVWLDFTWDLKYLLTVEITHGKNYKLY